MEETSIEQAVLNQMATNYSMKLAQLESEKAMLQVDNQLLRERIDQLANESNTKEGD